MNRIVYPKKAGLHFCDDTICSRFAYITYKCMYYSLRLWSGIFFQMLTMERNYSNFTKETSIHESAVPPVTEFVLGVLAVVVAVIVLSRDKHKQRPFYRLVAALALTDGGGILLVYPTVMLRYVSNFTYVFSDSLCGYSSFIFTYTILCSAMIICVMSLDRFMAIVYPFKYKSGNRYWCVNFTLLAIFTFNFLFVCYIQSAQALRLIIIRVPGVSLILPKVLLATFSIPAFIPYFSWSYSLQRLSSI